MEDPPERQAPLVSDADLFDDLPPAAPPAPALPWALAISLTSKDFQMYVKLANSSEHGGAYSSLGRRSIVVIANDLEEADARSHPMITISLI